MSTDGAVAKKNKQQQQTTSVPNHYTNLSTTQIAYNMALSNRACPHHIGNVLRLRSDCGTRRIITSLPGGLKHSVLIPPRKRAAHARHVRRGADVEPALIATLEGQEKR